MTFVRGGKEDYSGRYEGGWKEDQSGRYEGVGRRATVAVMRGWGGGPQWPL